MKPMLVVWLTAKPPYPKELHAANLSSILNLRMRSIELGMIDTNDPSIPKLFVDITHFILVRWWSSNYDIGAGGKMDRV
jgi:hypothetical protein